MLYVFYGDSAQAGAKARTLVESLRTKRPDAAYEKIDRDSWNPAIVESHLGGQGLFSSKYIVFLDRVTENSEAKETLADFVEAMQESANIFIVFEGKVLTDLKKEFAKHAEKVVECEPKSSAAPKPEFNIFGLADAVGRKDPIRAWMLYRQAVESSAESEAVIGMLFWKAKMINDKKLARELVTLYHDGHRGLVDLELGIERLVLNLRP